jgi:APA family basic amino acid/polyamine antiporter
MIIENEGLKREIGVWGLASNSINIIIGAGIFILPAIVAERLGNAGIWPYIICGILMILIMLCFAEIGTKITVILRLHSESMQDFSLPIFLFLVLQ